MVPILLSKIRSLYSDLQGPHRFGPLLTPLLLHPCSFRSHIAFSPIEKLFTKKWLTLISFRSLLKSHLFSHLLPPLPKSHHLPLPFHTLFPFLLFFPFSIIIGQFFIFLVSCFHLIEFNLQKGRIFIMFANVS